MKTLVTFFSVEYQNTRKVAQALANKLNADIFEIIPKEPYTKADINWRNPISRCNREFFGKKEVPVQNKVENMDEMFRVLSKITTLDLSTFNINKVTKIDGIFSNHNNLRGSAGTSYSSTMDTATCARVDVGTSSPGYFTLKTT